MAIKPIALFWSGGKDSAITLDLLLKSEDFEVKLLITSFVTETNRVGMHGLRQELIERQSAESQIPLLKMYFDSSVDFKSYETSFSEICQLLKQSNIYHIAFGDIFLEDLKLYRDKLCNINSVTPVYPLWKKSSNEVFDYFEKNHFEAIICTANAAYFEMNDLGKSLSKNLLSKTKLPVDLCGENGEYHTFCTNTPYFKNKIEPQKGNIEIRDFNFKTENETEMQSRFYYIDLEIE